MIDEALKSLMALFYTTLAVIFLWLLSWPTASENFRLYRAAIDLHPWVYMKDRLSSLKIDVFEADPGSDITDDMEEGEPKAPNYESQPEFVPLEVSVTWPMQRTERFHLTPAGFSQKALTAAGASARVYRIVTDSTQLPLSDYYAIFLKDTEPVLEDGEVLDRERRRVGLVPTDYRLFKLRDPGIRQVTSGLDNENHPKRWAEIKLYLERYGFTGTSEKLTVSERALARLRAAVDSTPPDVHLFGVQLSVGQFFFAVGGVLAAISFTMIGPLATLRSSFLRKNSQPWVFVLSNSGTRAGLTLEWIIFTVTSAWAISPLIILLLQIKLYVELGISGGWAFPLGAAGLVFSTMVFGTAAWELRKTRLFSRNHG